MTDDIIPLCLVRDYKPPEPKFRTCYRCGQKKLIEQFAKSPSPDVCNLGRTWACISCLTRDSINEYGVYTG